MSPDLLTALKTRFTTCREREEPSSDPASGETIDVRALIPVSFLIHADSVLRSRQRIQKFAVLLDDGIADTTVYKFTKYDYGPYSKQLEHDLATLDELGLIHINTTYTFDGSPRYTYRLTENGRTHFEDTLTDTEVLQRLHEHTESVVEEYGDLPLSNLIQHVCDVHPEYWENSVYETRYD